MQTQLSRDQAKPSLWSQSGPILLLGAFGVLLFKLIRSGIDPLWLLLFSTSLAISWFLIFLGRQEVKAFILSREGEISVLEENCRSFEKQLRDAKASLLQENKESIAERERLSCLYAQAELVLSQVKHSLEISEKERETLAEKCVALSQEISSYQQKKIAFQQLVEDADIQLLKLKNRQGTEPAVENPVVTTSIVPQEEIDPQEKMQLEQAKRQYALLREQFDEKSETLDKARKELFHTENELLALQKNCEEKGYEISEENLFLFKDLQALEEERRDLEAQVASLQDFISSLLNPKKRPSRSRKASISAESQERLPLLIQEKIDQTLPVT